MKRVINMPYIKRVEKPWGYELIFTPEDLPYAGKIMHLNARTRQSLQYHDKKIETYFLNDFFGGNLTKKFRKTSIATTIIPAARLILPAKLFKSTINVLLSIFHKDRGS